MKDSRAELNKQGYKRQRLIGACVTLGIVAVLLVFVFCVWFTGIRIDDSGMSPTLERGDVVFFDKLSRFVRRPERGDIIAYSGADGIKLGRIVALPGERVETAGGKLYINGVLLDERVYTDEPDPDMQETLLLENEYFLMPDARSAMVAQPGGMIVSIDEFLGKAAIRVSPIEEFGVFE